MLEHHFRQVAAPLSDLRVVTRNRSQVALELFLPRAAAARESDVLFSLSLIIAPEKTMTGSSTGPARSLALIFASRTILLRLVFVVLAYRRKREALAWVLLADAALQLFDIGMALATNKGALAVFPAVLGAMDVWAGLFLLRATRVSPALPSPRT
ncbi:MAG TPA: hypothetical protein VE093_34880 [Polyangiaceae bacterium]|jgi:hypothetical protein|nr:hypothetical protein [Polyangiaceae bacterium]